MCLQASKETLDTLKNITWNMHTRQPLFSCVSLNKQLFSIPFSDVVEMTELIDD